MDIAAPARHLAVVAGSSALIYLSLITLLRVAGLRQLAQLTTVDLLVVLLLGSAVETAMIHGDITLPAGLVSAGTLLVLNRLVTGASLRVKALRSWLGGTPTLLVHDGRVIEPHLRRAGVTRDDLEAAIRARAVQDVSDVRCAVLEMDGSISVIPIP